MGKITNQELDSTLATKLTNSDTHISNTSNPHSTTAAQVGLGNVTNESKATMFTNAALTGVPTAPTADNGTNTTQLATTAFVLANGVSLATVLAAVYPVGAIYMAVSPTSPATLFGFGTWAAWGAGRVPVGVDAGQTEFNTVEETGGAKTHTLATSEMPSHTHTQNAHSHGGVLSYDYNWGSINSSIHGLHPFAANTGSATATNQNTGGDGAHNNLQPYITCYMWKRTA